MITVRGNVPGKICVDVPNVGTVDIDATLDLYTGLHALADALEPLLSAYVSDAVASAMAAATAKATK